MTMIDPVLPIYPEHLQTSSNLFTQTLTAS